MNSALLTGLYVITRGSLSHILRLGCLWKHLILFGWPPKNTENYANAMLMFGFLLKTDLSATKLKGFVAKKMPLEPRRKEPDSSLLSEFATGCQLPETIQIVLGYESLESEELSWSTGETVNLHSLKKATWVIARDENGNEFSIPLAYPGKIFESIPQGCREKYETVEELIVAFPKYFRSLRDIPESGVTAGDILQLVEASKDDGGSKQLRCRMVGKSCTIVLSRNLSGPFETLGNVNPGCLREVIDGLSLPVRVRVQSGKTIQALDGTNTTPPVKFDGLLSLGQTVQQKVFIVSILHEKQLRVLKLPIDLEITVKREESKLDANLFSRICHLIQTEINIDSAITCGSTGDVSWYFEIQTDPTSDHNENVYEEIRPQVPPRSPVKPSCESDLKQNKINSVDTRYGTPTPRQQPLKKPSVPVKPNRREMKPLPPLVAKTPNVVMPKQLKKELPPSSCRPPKQKGGSELNNTASQSYVEPRNPDADPPGYCRLQEVMPKGLKDEGMVQRGNKVKPPKEMVEEGGNDVALKESHKESKLCSSENTAQGHQTTCNESPREHLEGISVSEVGEWLRKLGLNQYVDTFADESIDGAMLLELDDETMQFVGIKNPLHRKKLSMFIQRGWIPKR